jgi:hypothetical protein
MSKNFKSELFIILILFFSIPSYAQFKVGVTGGLNISKFTVSDDEYKEYNDKVRPGFIIGPTVIYNIPKTNLGLDISALFDQRGAKSKTYEDFEPIRCYSFQFPINIRYNIVLEDMDTAYGFLFTGLQFGLSTGNNDQLIVSGKGKSSGHELERRWVNQTSTFSWNFGVGGVVFNKVQVRISYNLALRKTGKIQQIDLTDGTSKTLTSGKAHACQVALSYLF